MITYTNEIRKIVETQLHGFCVGWRNPLTSQQLYKILCNSDKFFIALDGEKVIGFVNCITDKVQFGFIPMIEVLPEYQGKGIGTKLMKRLFDELEDISCIDLTCDPNIQPFYEKLGMVKSTGMIIRK